MPATIKDIASDTGLSVNTVSHILSGKRAHLFRESTCEKVHEAAKRLDYTPNYLAQAMRSGRFNSIGLILSSDGSSSLITERRLNPILAKCHELNYHVIVCQLDALNLKEEGSLPIAARHLMVDGFINNYNTALPQRFIEALERRNQPIVSLNLKKDIDCVYPDDFNGAYDATLELVKREHRRIAYVDLNRYDKKERHYSVYDRRDGYAAALAQSGLAPIWITNESGFREHERLDFALKTLEDPSQRPDAFLCYNDNMVGTLMMALIHYGVSLNQASPFTAFSISGTSALGTKINAVLLPEREMGMLAVEQLALKIENHDYTFKSIAVPPKIVMA